MGKIYNSFIDMMTDEKLWISIGMGVLNIVLIALVSMIVVRIANKMIKKSFELRLKVPGEMTPQTERRYRTILRLVQSVISYVVYFSAILAILSILNVNLSGLLAGAGIAGLAIGFGAQSLVKDVITGFFIIFEDQFGVGDYVKISAIEGTVLEIGLRTTKVKGVTGEINIIPNGTISEVINYSINNSAAVVDVSISYNANISLAEKLIEDYLDGLETKHEEIVTPPTLLGIQNVVGAEITLRISLETLPLQQFGVSRMIRKDIKAIFDANNIEIPYPKMMVYERDMNSGVEGEE